MAADSTVNIDVVLHKEQVQQASKEIDQNLKEIGQGAGDKAEKSIKNNMDKAVNDTKEAHDQMKQAVDKPVKQKVDHELLWYH